VSKALKWCISECKLMAKEGTSGKWSSSKKQSGISTATCCQGGSSLGNIINSENAQYFAWWMSSLMSVNEPLYSPILSVLSGIPHQFTNIINVLGLALIYFYITILPVVGIHSYLKLFVPKDTGTASCQLQQIKMICHLEYYPCTTFGLMASERQIQKVNQGSQN
jgi:hypothetical protein